jgi:hypothetical protein
MTGCGPGPSKLSGPLQPDFSPRPSYPALVDWHTFAIALVPWLTVPTLMLLYELPGFVRSVERPAWTMRRHRFSVRGSFDDGSVLEREVTVRGRSMEDAWLRLLESFPEVRAPLRARTTSPLDWKTVNAAPEPTLLNPQMPRELRLSSLACRHPCSHRNRKDDKCEDVSGQRERHEWE